MADKTKFLADIASSSADVRFAAWRSASEQGAEIIPELAKRAGGTDPGRNKAALEAMATLTHSVGKDIAGAKRGEVAQALVSVASSGTYALPVRAQALRLISLVGDDPAVLPVAKLLGNPELREEAVYCLERIPGAAAAKALLAAYPQAPRDFKPRVLAALGHRREADAVPLCVTAMQSGDREVAMAAMKAFGRIGRKPPAPPRYPSLRGLSLSQTMDHMDSRLRYADAQAAAGNHAEAMQVYKAALDAGEEHWQCAAIVGLGRISTAEAAVLIFPKLKSPNRNVRLTAQRTWRTIGSAGQG